ncbi:aspartyl/asparaginyl beta-hydroxylase domain-containing protein [Pseudoalteromonas obscura]|uniref:Aspartyl/asparaginyl beta-hydroxylase domain-containing protein n=1 Tax=Pseudoalteromonas obscura TaxID=3048491 RepID=A0ABT7EH46_9GAMM|nr:aspartyl/asparaginyl beta-hydroxylase domain-containing protein [Pseudoalteromonas sp. P94(2023)]MDK2594367.1 aspartyl/asparaginyl beta-hydroxylase domain-containing protein [Pseudoalteromonas sp. P94(2023)]
MSLSICSKLNMDIDLPELKKELEIIQRLQWHKESPFIAENVPGLNTTVYHSGNWKVVSLRSLGGSESRTDPGGPSIHDYEYNEMSKHTPYIRKLMSYFGGDIRTVRLSSMGPGMSIQEHCDTFVALQYGQVRLHIPIQTDENVIMRFGKEEFHWPEGELWYGDFSVPHSVDNGSDKHRIHLIFDAYITDKLLELFPQSEQKAIAAKQILSHQNSQPLAVESLKKYQCDFDISAALLKGIFETDDGILGIISGQIKLINNSELQFWLDEKPLFTLEPLSDGLFKFRGWSVERTIEFKWHQDTLSEMVWQFNCGLHKTLVTIPVTATTETSAKPRLVERQCEPCV